MRPRLLLQALATAPIAMRGIALALGLAACSESGSLGSLASDAGPSPTTRDEGGVEGTGGVAPPVARSTVAIAAGGHTTCVKGGAGKVQCWGWNGGGQLGIGDTEPSASSTPVTPVGLGTMQAVFGGEVAQAALDASGKVHLWGDIFVGDLGGGMTFDHLPSVVPSTIEGVSAVSSVAVGRYFTCLLDAAGDIRCYGLNAHGEVGVGDTERRALPTTVKGLDAAATSIAASMGGTWACATTHSGAVYCWGDDGTGVPVTTPRAVGGLAGPAASVVVGRAHACALLRSGTVTCWGKNDEGQLGDGTRSSGATPVPVLYLTDVASLSAGADHTCAVRQEGSVLCWGKNDAGQASESGDGTRPFLMVPASFGTTSVACGVAHSCAIGAGSKVHCWGEPGGPVDATF